MSSKIRWSLPDGVDELLPPKAIEVEMLRRKLIDEYISSGFEFITPPFIIVGSNLASYRILEISDVVVVFPCSKISTLLI